MALPSLSLVLKIATAPWVILKTTFEYYVTGTVYTQTDPEFDSLAKNLNVATAIHLAQGIRGRDADLVMGLMYSYFARYKNMPAVLGLPHYGEKVVDEETLAWLVKPEGAKKALLYFHGGGYLFPFAPQQFAGMIGVWYAVDSEKRQDLAIAMLDYLVTSHEKYYPTQIYEAVKAYRQLVDQGYEVIPMGDSAGGNLALAVARFAAYPTEAEAQFSRYTDFNWDFLPLPPPKTLVLIAPWVHTDKGAAIYPGVNHDGDFIRLSVNSKGDLYITGLDRKSVAPFVDFNGTTYEDHWAKVPAFVDGAILYIYGERELLRGSQELFAKEKDKGTFTTKMQPGGIHDAMFVVDVLDINLKKGMADVVAGKHRSKFNFGAVGEFLDSRL
ncbi:hypothetical protein C7M61_000208 [Candidozyma pseudohaemuli]|uniref:Alpha/beta hydrolase fold-3 domain-containing protein n=1 Tax=Candidozyma pseudohaemuli TaxID=418784 RepID=A0A2P7YX56_9ASCO|nr:hypothetical protein C7M61_000208 [[Candida] pseudohaemulonii]PSK40561.1 hypothetical protein C7M61_000208 [[Candida] pseudohaemulonii]